MLKNTLLLCTLAIFGFMGLQASDNQITPSLCKDKKPSELACGKTKPKKEEPTQLAGCCQKRKKKKKVQPVELTCGKKHPKKDNENQLACKEDVKKDQILACKDCR